MFRVQCLVICFLVYVAIGDASSVSFIEACKPKDRPCHKASAIGALPHFVAGVPELGIPASDPVILGDVNADDKDLKLRFRNLKVIGLKKCVVVDLIRDLEKSTLKLIVTCPITVTGQYTLNGKLLFVTAEGDGDIMIATDKVKIEATIKIKTVESGGKKYWKITSYDYTYDIVDKATIDLKNLFGGDEARAKPIREIFNESSKELITEVGPGIIDQMVAKVIEHVRIFFKEVPVSDLQLD